MKHFWEAVAIIISILQRRTQAKSKCKNVESCFRRGDKPAKADASEIKMQNVKLWIPAPAFAGVTILRRNDSGVGIKETTA